MAQPLFPPLNQGDTFSGLGNPEILLYPLLAQSAVGIAPSAGRYASKVTCKRIKEEVVSNMMNNSIILLQKRASREREREDVRERERERERERDREREREKEREKKREMHLRTIRSL